ncbi:MgtC/SapB family protein [Kitasatospora kifunensis]|uniref:Putative Mg2+ transporter-C (MgtC) family protein n=1 Tax=Kitasatospora kifunensis TaxID=58351 RepID=A0A7W7R8P1_KITKI|nr:MgtC/SapB family protein [Kitasatospora kifunensis]MBB4927369.1 putative Mg2+ transporter-C (MgtC) family protein [Kitasatospora kifunensis]
MTGHLLAAFALTYAIGFERNVRGAAAGDRTFSLIGVGAALVAVLAQHGAPNALTGVITGVGFIGGGLTFRETRANGDVVRGVTTAATIFAAAAIGAAAGEGFLLFALTGTVLTLLTLEIRHIPVLRVLDGRRWARPFAEDECIDLDGSPARLDPEAGELLDTAACPDSADYASPAARR